MHNANCYCPECGAMMAYVVSGAICPRGHGRIRPDISSADLRRERVATARDLERLHRYDGLPRCHTLYLKAIEREGSTHRPRLWVIDGQPGFYYMGYVHDSAVAAYDAARRRKVHLFKLFDSVEELLKPSQGG